MQLLSKNHIRKIFKPRKANSHKGDHGHTLIVAGKKGSIGAAVIAAQACLRSGTGLLSVVVPAEERTILQTAIPEAMLIMREQFNDGLLPFSAMGIGPALGTDKPAADMLINIMTRCKMPLLLDADALNIISADKIHFDLVPEHTVITPHPKEFDRLFGPHENEEERRRTAIEQAEKKKIVIVLKGTYTLITAKGKSFINNTGNSGLAKGGSGDALTGIITAFLAQGYESFDAAKLGVYIHGLAADIALKKQSPESMLISDVIKCLGKAFKKIN